MACPDELTLDLWLAEALPLDEAALVATHVPSCAACTSAVQASQSLAAELHHALSLDVEETAYLTSLELAAPWRTNHTAAAEFWGWVALAGAIGGYAAWAVAGPWFGPVIAATAQAGLGLAPLHLALGFSAELGRNLLNLAQHPALDLSQPFLAALALALLFWPRQLISERTARS